MRQNNNVAILNVGRVYCDLVFSGIDKMPTLGEEIYADSFAMHAGGGAFITAAHLKTLGHTSSISAFVQDGPFGQLLMKEFSRAELDSSPCETASASWGSQLTIAMAHRGDRAFLTKRGEKAVPSITQSVIAKKRHQHLHIGELATLLERPELIGWARKANMSISLDCSWDEEAMRSANVLQLIGQADLFLPNESEVQFLIEAHQRFSATDLAKALGGCVLVEKKGPEGAIAYIDGETVSAASQPIDVVDATGAGDAFNAGFISAWLEKRSTKQCLEAGNRKALDALVTMGGIAAE